MRALKNSRFSIIKNGSITLLSIGRDFNGLPLPTNGYSDLKIGLQPFNVDVSIEVEATHELSINVDETQAVIDSKGKYFIEATGGGLAFSQVGEILKAVANNDGKYIRFGKLITGYNLPSLPIADLSGNEYTPLMSIEFESLQDSSISLDFSQLLIADNGDVFVKALTINN